MNVCGGDTPLRRLRYAALTEPVYLAAEALRPRFKLAGGAVSVVLTVEAGYE